jgi:PAS domain-containing protein
LTAPSQAQPDQAAVLFANVFHQVDAALLVLDEAGTITLSNPAAERLLGIGGHVLCGHHISTLLLCEAKAMVSGGLPPVFQSGRDLLALFNAGLMPGHGLPREWVVADRDGSRHMVSISASPLIQVMSPAMCW